MKIINLLFVFLLMSSFLLAQNDQDFIKIVGQSRLKIESTGYFVKFKIEEVERNEYQKIQARTLDDVKLDLQNHLKSLGYKTSDMTELLPNSGGYKSKLNENYSMKFKSIDDVKNFKQAQFSGFTVTVVSYSYDNTIDIDDKALAEDAISDARRKAQSLAKFIDRKVGEVISLHDRSYTSLKIPKTSRDKEYVVKYDVTISFELINQ